MARIWKRASKPKSRTGCATCKIRHVKCDEEKPACAQCRKTGRKCDGYDKQPPKKPDNRVVARPAPKIPSSSHVVLLPGTREEQKYVHFFCTQTTRVMSGVFQTELWDKIIPQISQSIPVVRHAVVAVSAAHERFLCRDSDSVIANNDFALRQYNKAIKHLIDYLSSPNQTMNLTLITCYLFMCLEMLKGENAQALNHLESGIKILHGRDTESQSSTVMTDIDRELSHLSLRLNIQLSLHGRQMMVFDLDGPGSDHPTAEEVVLTDIPEARHALDRLMNKGLVFVREATDKKAVARDSYFPRQQQLSQELRAWKLAFEKLTATDRGQQNHVDPRAPLLLWVQFRVSLIWVETCLAMDEVIYDEYNETFEAVVSGAEELVEINNGVGSVEDHLNSQFTLEAGLIPMLYWCAVKCRDPLIRRRALNVIASSPQQEGLWRRRRFIEVAQMVIDVEEKDMQSLPIEQRVPADEQRVYETIGEDVKDTSPCQITTLMKPNGWDKDWACETKLVYWI
ncbi:Zn(II)2Cys6 transcription factor [Aspergillus affinis]|uniref:Zn(II)2Cys6 transcription factor n=1 Tax=Aspergillus affinis TaxID=1070780 RepID=UPI0022FE9931|nr:C6 zinc finger domain protein [Aspergillus affinis]KAI9036758.1 C6 zinc finger domain protein [Aspergillus affinis]